MYPSGVWRGYWEHAAFRPPTHERLHPALCRRRRRWRGPRASSAASPSAGPATTRAMSSWSSSTSADIESSTAAATTERGRSTGRGPSAISGRGRSPQPGAAPRPHQGFADSGHLLTGFRGFSSGGSSIAPGGGVPLPAGMSAARRLLVLGRRHALPAPSSRRRPPLAGASASERGCTSRSRCRRRRTPTTGSARAAASADEIHQLAARHVKAVAYLGVKVLDATRNGRTAFAILTVSIRSHRRRRLRLGPESSCSVRSSCAVSAAWAFAFWKPCGGPACPSSSWTMSASLEQPRLGGARLVHGDCRRHNVLEAAGVADCGGVLVLTNDDLLNVTTALTGAGHLPRLRVVMRMFNHNLIGRLGEAVQNVFALSTSMLTAPIVALTALTGQALGAFRLEGLVGRIGGRSRGDHPGRL